MTQQAISLSTSDGAVLKGYAWIVADAFGHIHIAHGMSEHAARYARFAAAMNAQGYSVTASDHRGHGHTALDNSQVPGHAGDNDSWQLLVNDLHAWWKHCYETYCVTDGHRPLVVLGHSLGSFMTLDAACMTTVPLAAIILIASGVRSRMFSWLQARIIGLLPHLPGMTYLERGITKSEVVQRLGFGAFNRRFKPNRTAFDWLSRETVEVDAYIADPLCGQACSLQLWSDFLDGVARLQTLSTVRQLKPDVPMLLLSGTRDPVGDEGTGAPALAARLRRAGVIDVKVELFAGARHELLNETNAAEVNLAICEWLKQKLQRK